MDHQTFDRLTRLVGTAASRRTAWRALLGAALLGATTRRAAAEPCVLCNGKCCPGKCFTNGPCEVCYLGKNIICEDEQGDLCCQKGGDDPCRACRPPTVSGEDRCLTGISGSYRRR